MMKPSSTENPVASTPNTPEARSPSLKKLPPGARRRTSSIAVTATAVTPARIASERSRFTSGVLARVDDADLAAYLVHGGHDPSGGGPRHRPGLEPPGGERPGHLGRLEPEAVGGHRGDELV